MYASVTRMGALLLVKSHSALLLSMMSATAMPMMAFCCRWSIGLPTAASKASMASPIVRHALLTGVAPHPQGDAETVFPRWVCLLYATLRISTTSYWQRFSHLMRAAVSWSMPVAMTRSLPFHSFMPTTS